MLEYSRFNRLSSGSQVEVLVEEGTVVARRRHKDWEITLYSLNNYFVELWVKQNLEIIGTFHKSVNPLTIMEPYTESIKIQEFPGL